VAESQADVYRHYNPGVEILAHPDEVETGVDGGLSRKAQWVLDLLGGDVFFLDDDVTGITRCFETKKAARECDPELAEPLVQHWADMCHDMGAFLYGAGASTSNPLSYGGQRPFRLTGRMYFCGMGILSGSKLKFNPKIKCYLDFWISCLNAYHHRTAFMDDRFAIEANETATGTEGNANYRNLSQLKFEFELMRDLFGPRIVSQKVGAMRAKAKHDYQIQISIPL
jgi:hypothetical protein